jgi:AbrB family looped-hinge helix DNA binding protein
MQTVKIQQRGVLTLPKKIRDTFKLYEGQNLRITHSENQIILEPSSEFDAQLMRDIKQGLDDIKNGDFIEFSSVKEMHQKLKTYVPKAHR